MTSTMTNNITTKLDQSNILKIKDLIGIKAKSNHNNGLILIINGRKKATKSIKNGNKIRNNTRTTHRMVHILTRRKIMVNFINKSSPIMSRRIPNLIDKFLISLKITNIVIMGNPSKAKINKMLELVSLMNHNCTLNSKKKSIRLRIINGKMNHNSNNSSNSNSRCSSLLEF